MSERSVPASASIEETVRRVVRELPGRDCGLCGFGNCRGFAKAVVAGKALPCGCRQDPGAARRIEKVLQAVQMRRKITRVEQRQSRPADGEGQTAAALQAELEAITKRADALLARIDTRKHQFQSVRTRG